MAWYDFLKRKSTYLIGAGVLFVGATSIKGTIDAYRSFFPPSQTIKIPDIQVKKGSLVKDVSGDGRIDFQYQGLDDKWHILTLGADGKTFISLLGIIEDRKNLENRINTGEPIKNTLPTNTEPISIDELLKCKDKAY
jgi:hypothetical protein